MAPRARPTPGPPGVAERFGGSSGASGRGCTPAAMSVELVRLVDDLEGRAAGYITLDDVERSAGRSVADEIAQGLLRGDYREVVDGSDVPTRVTLCVRYRHHPLLREVTAFEPADQDAETGK